jgi:hypothetical protein
MNIIPPEIIRSCLFVHLTVSPDCADFDRLFENQESDFEPLENLRRLRNLLMAMRCVSQKLKKLMTISSYLTPKGDGIIPTFCGSIIDQLDFYRNCKLKKRIYQHWNFAIKRIKFFGKFGKCKKIQILSFLCSREYIRIGENYIFTFEISTNYGIFRSKIPIECSRKLVSNDILIEVEIDQEYHNYNWLTALSIGQFDQPFKQIITYNEAPIACIALMDTDIFSFSFAENNWLNKFHSMYYRACEDAERSCKESLDHIGYLVANEGLNENYLEKKLSSIYCLDSEKVKAMICTI